jgi:hypothetical protein
MPRERYKLIPLWRKDGTVVSYAKVSYADYDWLNRWRWFLNSAGYAIRYERHAGIQRFILMHRELLGLQRGDRRQGDHENGNRLDNTRANLRIATHGQNLQNRIGLNAMNTSGYRGVAWNKRKHKWHAYARVDGRRQHLGYYATAEEAACVVSAWRAEHMPFATD